MRRIAILLLIALLPLQSIWAAAANACQGGCSSGNSDFGHHEHEHTGVLSAADDASADTPGDQVSGCSADGSSYHGHASVAVIVDDRPPLGAARSGVMPGPYQRSFSDHFLDSPLRPPQLPLV